VPQADTRPKPGALHAPVIVNCRFLSRPVTGVERFAEELLWQLVSLRDDLVLVAPGRGQLRRSTINGVPVHRVGRSSGHLWEQTELAQLARRRQRAILLSLANTGPAFSRRQIVAIHDITHRRHKESYSSAFRSLYSVLTPLLVRSADTVITVSEFSRQELIDYYGRSSGLVVIPNAPSDWVLGESIKPSGLPFGSFFLLVGSPSPHKNITTAITAFQNYRASGGLSRLVIAGAAHISLAGVDIGVTDGVWMAGRVSDQELAWLYRHSRAFIFPSLYEGFGIPPLEAQAAGVPVLVSDIPALREILTPESAIWFPPTAVERLTDAMHEVDTDPIGAARVAEMGRLNAQRYSWEASARSLSALIDAVKARPQVRHHPRG
jgi:glycosyltransferase involved in cell wall biosynthesis